MKRWVLFGVIITLLVIVWLYLSFTLHDEGFFRRMMLISGGVLAGYSFYIGLRNGGWKFIDVSFVLIIAIVFGFIIGSFNMGIVSIQNAPSTLLDSIKGAFGAKQPQQSIIETLRTLWVMLELMIPALVGLMCGLALPRKKEKEKK